MSPNRAKLRFFCKTLRHMEFPMHVFFLNLRFLPPKSKSLWSGFYAGPASNLCDKACNFGVATCHCLRYQTGFQALCQVQSIQSGTFFATRAPYLHFQLHIACRLLKLQQSRAQHASKIRRLVGWKNGCGGDVSKGAMLLNNHHLHC